MSSVNNKENKSVENLLYDLQQTSYTCWESLFDLDRKIIETALKNWKIGAEQPQFQRCAPEQFPYGRRLTGFSDRLYIHLNKSAIDGVAGRGKIFKVKWAFLLVFNDQGQLTMKKVAVATTPVKNLLEFPDFQNILAAIREASPQRQKRLCVPRDWGTYPGKEDVEKFALFMDSYPEDLWERLQFGNLNPVAMSREERNRLIEDLLIAIRNLHALGIIHCDIKEENLFLDERGHLFLGDFNLSTFMGKEGLGGSYLYAHPQRLCFGPKKASPSWDLYPAGIVIAELLLAASPSKESMQKRRGPILVTPRPHLQLLREYTQFLCEELNESLRSFVSGLLHQNWTAEYALQRFRTLVANGEDQNPVLGKEDLLGLEFLEIS